MCSNKNDRWDAQHYKKHSAAMFKKRVSVVYDYNFRGNENVLDVGCGDGRITAEIAKKVSGGYVLGIDVSESMIAEAKRCFGDIKNLEFQCADATKFTTDKQFDLAVSFGVFHWISDQLGALKNIYKHLKPGGKLISLRTAAPFKGPITAVKESEKWVHLLPKAEDETFFPRTAEEFYKLLEEAGFKDIDVKLQFSSRTFSSKDDLFNWAFAWIPHSTKLPDDEAREYAQDIVDRVCAARDDGQIIVESALLDATAVK